MALGASAQASPDAAASSSASLVKTTVVKTPRVSVSPIGGSRSLRVRSLGDARVKTFAPLRHSATVINPRLAAKAPLRSAAAAAGASLFENFESGELPAGWSLQSKTQAPSGVEFDGWEISKGDDYVIIPFDGEYCASVAYNADVELDEWLITPEIEIADNEEVRFYLSLMPAFFNSLENVDFGSFEYVGDPIRIGDVEVWAKTPETDWTMLWSCMDNFDGMSFEELSSIEGYRQWHVSLVDYAGKKVQLAFRYRGKDCNTITLDCVEVGKLPLEGVSYMDPLETLFFGLDRSETWVGMNSDLAIYPVFADLTWTNTSEAGNATFSWEYTDPVTSTPAYSDDQDQLTVSYIPDFTSEETSRNNFFYAPLLSGVADGTSPGYYQRNYLYFQAGGAPEYAAMLPGASEPQMMQFGMLPFPQNADGLTTLIVDDETIGDMAIPVFGHNANTDRYWLNYTLAGSEPEEGDDVKLTSIINFIYPSSQPLVLNGAHVLGIGKIQEGAEFRLQIISLGEDYDISRGEVVAEATCAYPDVKIAMNGTNDFLNVIFDFDRPVVLDNSSATAYVVKFSGFNSDKVDYFAPIQSYRPDANYLCFGWLEKMIKVGTPDYRYSYSPVANTVGDYGDCFNGFAIILDGCYPFLACDTKEITIPYYGASVAVSLGSYYDGKDLTVETPAGLLATVKGRYDKCMLVLTPDCTADLDNAEVVVKAPGVEHRIRVNYTNAIDNIEAEGGKTVVATYAVDGTRLSDDAARNGIFIVRYSDGTTAKVVR